MENGAKRPDRPPLAQATVRAAARSAATLLPNLKLFAAGKSFGGRMTSQAQADDPLPAVRGLIFFGFPLHPAKQPSTRRAQHLGTINIPMLFIHGTRDALADTALLVSIIGALGPAATLHRIENVDHSFHVPARLGGNDQDVLDDLLTEAVIWMHDTLRT